MLKIQILFCILGNSRMHYDYVFVFISFLSRRLKFITSSSDTVYCAISNIFIYRFPCLKKIIFTNTRNFKLIEIFLVLILPFRFLYISNFLCLSPYWIESLENYCSNICNSTRFFRFKVFSVKLRICNVTIIIWNDCFPGRVLAISMSFVSSAVTKHRFLQ